MMIYWEGMYVQTLQSRVINIANETIEVAERPAVQHVIGLI